MHDRPSASFLTRRHFLSLGVGVAMTLVLPTSGFSKELDPIASKLQELKASPDPQHFPTRKPRAPRLLMIDPGHGGHDPGAIGRSGTQEKEITLDIARRMASLITKEPMVDAKLTRDDDTFIPLPERVRMTEEAHADFFISIHADSASPDAHGLSVYTLSEKASDSFAKALEKQENSIQAMGGADLSADKDVAAILMDLTTRRTRNTSQRARFEFVHGIGRSWPLLTRPMRAANFAVLRAPDVPSMLIETGFLSNLQDEAKLRQPAMRQKIAALMAKEITEILTSPAFG